MTFSTPEFDTRYEKILQRVEAMDVNNYSRTRNFIDGAVTYLSPYISRGVISPAMLKRKITSRYKIDQSFRLLQELAWREYFKRVLEARPDVLYEDAKNPATQHYEEIPVSIMNAATGIEAIDQGISHLYDTGYMHNHLRMYTSMLACNVADTKWQQPARWLYYHLLDGDLASNHLNWQWVAGTFSIKKYIANQENINNYAHTKQTGTFLDVPYEQLPLTGIPAVFEHRAPFTLGTKLPEPPPLELNQDKSLLIYNSYNLDPLWEKGHKANRVLLLEPAHFDKYPVSSRVLEFILALSKNIPGMQVFVGSFDELCALYDDDTAEIYFKDHPMNAHYRGESVEREWMFPEVSGYFPSFTNYWKKCEKELKG